MLNEPVYGLTLPILPLWLLDSESAVRCGGHVRLYYSQVGTEGIARRNDHQKLLYGSINQWVLKRQLLPAFWLATSISALRSNASRHPVTGSLRKILPTDTLAQSIR